MIQTTYLYKFLYYSDLSPCPNWHVIFLTNKYKNLTWYIINLYMYHMPFKQYNIQWPSIQSLRHLSWDHRPVGPTFLWKSIWQWSPFPNWQMSQPQLVLIEYQPTYQCAPKSRSCILTVYISFLIFLLRKQSILLYLLLTTTPIWGGYLESHCPHPTLPVQHTLEATLLATSPTWGGYLAPIIHHHAKTTLP